MPRPYDNDLRRMFLAAYAAGKGTQAELALVFGVSVGWAEKICRQHRLSGQPERIEQRHGPTSRVDAAAQACLLDAIKERPDLTLAELQEILAVRQGVRLCIGQLWNVLKKMGIRLKKSRSTPPSATQKAIVKSENNSSNVSGQRRRTT
jgi:transposase